MAKQPVAIVQHRPWSDEDDHGLMRHIARANRQAFTELARRHMPGMRMFARRYVSRNDADDIVQDCLTNIWLKAGQWQDRGVSPRSWLLRIVYNRCMDSLRRRQVDCEYISDDLGDSSATPEQIYEAGLRQRQLALAMQALPERQRSAIQLTVYHALSNKESAEVLGVSVEALESLLSRARKQLQKLIQQQGES